MDRLSNFHVTQAVFEVRHVQVFRSWWHNITLWTIEHFLQFVVRVQWATIGNSGWHTVMDRLSNFHVTQAVFEVRHVQVFRSWWHNITLWTIEHFLQFVVRVQWATIGNSGWQTVMKRLSNFHVTQAVFKVRHVQVFRSWW